jgi:glucose/arabinose dehydrogenase
MRLLLVAVTAGAAGVLASGLHGAGGNTAAAPPPSQAPVAVTLVDFRIRLSRTVVRPGRVVFQVVNKGRLIHDIEFPGRGGSRQLRPGQSQRFALTFRKGGTYRYLCAISGHAALGMKGTLRVGKGAPPKPTPPKPPVVDGKDLQLSLVAKGLGPLTYVTSPPGDATRLLLLQQDGLVRLIKDGTVQSLPFLDLRDRVHADGEKGLLSLAFAPDYETSRLLYVYYNDFASNVRVVGFRGDADEPDHVDPATAHQLLEIAKPDADHNGGMMQFGPDGDLYIAVGDGGARPPTIPIGAYGQTLDDLLGSILRIDPGHGDPYAIPDGNPFIATPGAKPEIVAYGLRNPWRFWIDADTDTMLIGDVGEASREEIDRLPLDQLGLNFGWPCDEGTIVPTIDPRPADCASASASFTPPIFDYPHTPTRCSIIGGVVARDPRIPTLDGLFLWTDLCEGVLYVIDSATAKPEATSLGLSVQEPTSFGMDAEHRIYLTTAKGEVYRLDPK